jgi:hypothetical protein
LKPFERIIQVLYCKIFFIVPYSQIYAERDNESQNCVNLTFKFFLKVLNSWRMESDFLMDRKIVFYIFFQAALLFFLVMCIRDHEAVASEISDSKPDIPRINSIGISKVQPQELDEDVIWYDDFTKEKPYLESSGDIDNSESFGNEGGSLNMGFRKGEISGEGNRKLAFGDFPDGSSVIEAGKHYDEIYWRIYVKHEYGWNGAPAKMSRATSIVSEKWQQAMIAHVWSGEANSITLDPASGVKGQSDSIMTTGYNDFSNLRWLGNKPGSSFQISSTSESGWWVLVEAGARLNTPGKSDGFFRLWIDGRLEAERTNLNFRGSYKAHGINAVFLESYWNEGAIKTEKRWFDNFVVSTKPIGPVTCPPNPVLYKTPYEGPGKLQTWEAEVATGYNGEDVVFRSGEAGVTESIVVSIEKGSFTGSLTTKTSLTSGAVCYCRVRQKSSNGNWSDWSRWHQPFVVE